jgi:HD superfamily phosphohydrolase
MHFAIVLGHNNYYKYLRCKNLGVFMCKYVGSACFMHDCGHSPFSHTFENFYNYTEARDSERAYERLYECFSNDDFKKSGSFKPAPHEAFSAVVLKEFYGS